MDFWKKIKRKGQRPGGVEKRERAGRSEGVGRSGLPGWLWGVFLGVLFLGIGAWQEQFEVIWRKAVMICLECIGVG